jgi:hypothetical protein
MKIEEVETFHATFVCSMMVRNTFLSATDIHAYICVRHAEGMRQHGANSTEAIA